jgi:hypothetical protein
MSGLKSRQRGPIGPVPPYAGRRRFRLRETHVRDHLGPLLNSSASGTVKLDLVLRGLAADSDGETPGLISADISWDYLHDLVRPASFYGNTATPLKRNWVGTKLAQLEERDLIHRARVPGSRSRLVVLRDDGSGLPFDDPGADRSTSYVTILGDIITFGWLPGWGTPELTAYLAAMIAERYARADQLFIGSDIAKKDELPNSPVGSGPWFRPLTWFADEDQQRPPDHIRMPFSERTLRRGFKLLSQDGLIQMERIRSDPRTGNTFPKGPRVLHHNGFHDLRPNSRTRWLRAHGEEPDPNKTTILEPPTTDLAADADAI